MNERFKDFCAKCQAIQMHFYASPDMKNNNYISLYAYDGQDNFLLRFCYRIKKRYHTKPYYKPFMLNLKPEYFKEIYFRFIHLNVKRNLQKQINKFYKFRTDNSSINKFTLPLVN